MMRAEFESFPDATVMRLEGRLVNLWARAVRAMATTCLPPPMLLVDLTDVTYVDACGEEVLKWLADVGAEFAAENCYSRDICRRLLLPKAKQATLFATDRCGQGTCSPPRLYPGE